MPRTYHVIHYRLRGDPPNNIKREELGSKVEADARVQVLRNQGHPAHYVGAFQQDSRGGIIIVRNQEPPGAST